MRKLAIIHFNPIESYPPVMNWLNYLAGHSKGQIGVRVITMDVPEGHARFDPPAGDIKIIRAGRSKKQNSLSRYWNYLVFYTRATGQLIGWRPDTVLYYETLSALPAVLYKRWINRGSRLLIHYHEYTSPKEYREGMVLSRWGHRLEKKVYPSAAWLSHTNEDRMGFFMEDHKSIPIANPHILPNYPPQSWQTAGRKRGAGFPALPAAPTRFVYVGALSLDTIYTREFADWVLRQQGKVTWDIYSGNMTGEARDLLFSLRSPWIRFHGSIDYFALPDTLRQYDIGVILYKGHIPNYIYNSPNKLFEYWACGLDTWFPEGMKGGIPFITTHNYPKILPVNFDRLDELDLSLLTDRGGLSERPCPYNCEEVLAPLFEEILPTHV